MRSVTPEQPKSPKPQDKQLCQHGINLTYYDCDKCVVDSLGKGPINKPETKVGSAESLIVINGNIIESLLAHSGWIIVEDLIDEGIASVSGRKTNGYYYNGSLTSGTKNKDYLTGYQEALVQLYNRIKDFIRERDKVLQSKKAEKEETEAPLINPFLEELHEKD